MGVDFEALQLLADQYEPDNDKTEAGFIATDGNIQYHTIHKSFDDDFVRFEAVSGQTYFFFRFAPGF